MEPLDNFRIYLFYLAESAEAHTIVYYLKGEGG